MGRRGDRPGTVRAIGSVLVALLVVLLLAFPALAGAGPTRLTDGAASPGSGTTATMFTMAVTYKSLNDSPPDYVRVTIGGQAHEMSQDSGKDPKHGVRFTWSGKLPAGTHDVTFGSRSRDRFDATLSGGAVTVTVPPTPAPTPKPTAKPTPAPTATSIPAPTAKPTAAPTAKPTAAPPTDAPVPTPAPRSGGTPTDAPVPTDATTPPGLSAPSPSPTPSAGPVTAAIVGPTGGTTGGPTGGATGGGSGGSDPNSATDGSAGPGSGSSRGSGTGGSWGPLSSAMATLGISGPRFPALTLAPALVTTTGAVTAAMAFGVFGRRRRDGEPPAPDEVLAAEAALGVGLASASLPSDRPGPEHNSGPGRPPALAEAAVASAILGPNDAEAGMPRWRRPSLLEARRADPIRDVTGPARLSFDHGLVGPLDGRERRLIRYNVVRLLDVPDELRGVEIGFLDQGDEVQLLERHGTYWLVLCPNGGQGWIHKMTLGDVVVDDDAPASNGATATMPTAADTWTMGDVDDDVLSAYLASRQRSG